MPKERRGTGWNLRLAELFEAPASPPNVRNRAEIFYMIGHSGLTTIENAERWREPAPWKTETRQHHMLLMVWT